VTAVARKNARTAGIMTLMVAGMLALAFASVPLYRMFCQLTGFDGTPLRANINKDLPWRFEPVQETVRIAPGARTQILYRATNLTARTITGSAVFNVSPEIAGQYFSKIECFCFSEQTLKGGETVDMPVVFYVDPRIHEDQDTKHIDEITLSYTFYPVEKPAAPR
jgi:cytochrome c oxidase assembly protein subunit 11